MHVERLAPNAAGRLKEIRLRALLDAPDAFGATYAEVSTRPPESWQQQIADLATFVAVVESKDVGMVRGAPDHSDPTSKWLISMWVAPEARGRGVGEALITAVVAWARQAGAAKMLLDVGDNNTPAIALYERMGFVPNGVTSTIPEPRTHVTEHQRVRELK